MTGKHSKKAAGRHVREPELATRAKHAVEATPATSAKARHAVEATPPMPIKAKHGRDKAATTEAKHAAAAEMASPSKSTFVPPPSFEVSTAPDADVTADLAA
ncbi:MAG: hypothetical protein LBL27_03580, partial [Coriobacteriales bacterium]|nr:hypothetical protein [Coriobacteriales bacterium]